MRRAARAWRGPALIAAAAALAPAGLGCRLGFDLSSAGGDDGAPSDGRTTPADASATPDAAPRRATAGAVIGFTPTAGPGSLAGVVVTGMAQGGGDDGWATAFLGPGESTLWGARFSSTFAPATAVPFQTTPSGGPGYSEASLGWDGAHVVAALNRPVDGGTYLKVLSNSLDSFGYIFLVAGEQPARPAFARAAGVTFGATFQGDRISAHFLDATTAEHTSTQPILALPAQGAPIVAAAAGEAAGAGLVVTELADGSCRLGAIFSPTASATATIPAPCAQPNVVALGGTWDGNQTLLVYRDGSGYLARWLNVDVPGQRVVLSSTVVALTSAPGPVQVVASSPVTALWLDGGQVRGALIPIDPTTPLTPLLVDGLPAGPPSAWTAAALGPAVAVFAVYDNALWIATW